MSLALYTSALIVWLIAIYNLAKIPWYLGWVNTPNYGLETSMPFHRMGYRGPKLTSHPTLFLAPHALMGAALLTLFGVYLVMEDTVPQFMHLYVAVSIVFGLHAIPERQGIPNRTKEGKPLNEVALTLLFSGTLLIFLGFPSVGMTISVLPLLGAAGMELSKPLKWCILRLLGREGPSISPDGDQPLPRNPNGYSGCPCGKFFDINNDVYPVLPEFRYTTIE